MKPVVVHLMGLTGAGKSTLLRAMKRMYSDRVGVIEVGKMLREKYGPGYFKGQAAPKHTQKEAWELYLDNVDRHIAEKKDVILVDGQPRDTQQAIDCVATWSGKASDVKVKFVLLHADESLRWKRLKRDRGDDPANLELARQRMTNDYRNHYVVSVELIRFGIGVELVDTTDCIDMNELACDLFVRWTVLEETITHDKS